jgi:hypothetical protein
MQLNVVGAAVVGELHRLARARCGVDREHQVAGARLIASGWGAHIDFE